MKQCDNKLCKHHASQTERMKRYGNMCLASKCENIADRENVRTILDLPVAEGYKNLHRLTKEELEYCKNLEPRKSGQAKLEQEIKKRK